MKRKLVSVQKIININPIEGADRIECTTILGWHCVSQKGKYNIGDLVLYCEIDSSFPENNLFSDLKDSHYRVKTRRFRGQISQGYILPISILKEYNPNIQFLNENIEGLIQTNQAIKYKDTESGLEVNLVLEEDVDVSHLLEVTKWEPLTNENNLGNTRDFPHFISKTEEIRCQSIPSIIASLKDTEMVIVEKIDGQSVTFYLKQDDALEQEHFGVCSRNLEIDKENSEGNRLWNMALKLDIEEKLRKYKADNGIDLAIQGELIGPSIQKNKYQLKETDFYAFNVIDISKSQYYDYEDMEKIAKELKIKTCPTINSNFLMNHTVDELVALSQGMSILNKKTQREGLVFRSKKEKFIDTIGRCSFKALNPKFLLKYDE